MDINKILQKVQELDDVIKEHGFYRDSMIELMPKSKKEPRVNIQFLSPSEEDEE